MYILTCVTIYKVMTLKKIVSLITVENPEFN